MTENFDIVALTASLGGVSALKAIVRTLPADFAAPVLIVQHAYAGSPRELLSEILQQGTTMRVKCVADGEILKPGTVYTVHPAYYPVVQPDLSVRLQPKLPNSHSADLLFESIARSCGARAIAVVLTGTGGDGARGVRLIKAAGGRVLVQDERTAAYFGMPGAAIGTGCVDFALPLRTIAFALIALVMVEGAADLFKVAVPAAA